MHCIVLFGVECGNKTWIFHLVLYSSKSLFFLLQIVSLVENRKSNYPACLTIRISNTVLKYLMIRLYGKCKKYFKMIIIYFKNSKFLGKFSISYHFRWSFNTELKYNLNFWTWYSNVQNMQYPTLKIVYDKFNITLPDK